eukprot:833140-Prorocentrum_minimum.AAC.1
MECAVAMDLCRTANAIRTTGPDPMDWPLRDVKNLLALSKDITSALSRPSYYASRCGGFLDTTPSYRRRIAVVSCVPLLPPTPFLTSMSLRILGVHNVGN